MNPGKKPVTATRERILREASKLFSEKGFHGAGTREIAAAVGIRQQSLRHHFATKRAILEVLLGYVVEEPLRMAQRMMASPGPPAARLYSYIRFDVAHLHGSPYVLRGLFGTYLLADPDLVTYYQSASDIYDAVAAMVTQGVAAGEFREIDSEFASAAVGALVEQTISVFEQYGSQPDVPSLVADFCLSGLLRDSTQLANVRSTSERLDLTGEL